MSEKSKKIITIIVIILVTLGIYSVGNAYILKHNRGDVHEAQRSMADSTVYNENDIVSAMDFVQNHFFLTFRGCKLTALWYPGDETIAQAEEWAAKYDADQAIVLVSNFDVDSSGGDGSLNPDSTYANWKWILTRDEGEDWVLETWGY